jgi:hypothetical protein
MPHSNDLEDGDREGNRDRSMFSRDDPLPSEVPINNSLWPIQECLSSKGSEHCIRVNALDREGWIYLLLERFLGRQATL